MKNDLHFGSVGSKIVFQVKYSGSEESTDNQHLKDNKDDLNILQAWISELKQLF